MNNILIRTIEIAIAGETHTLAVAMEDTTIVGTIALMKTGEVASIARLYVSPLYRKQGIGARLVRWACNIAFDCLACKGLNLAVERNNTDVLPFYERIGFKRVGEFSHEIMLFIELPAWKGKTPPPPEAGA